MRKEFKIWGTAMLLSLLSTPALALKRVAASAAPAASASCPVLVPVKKIGVCLGAYLPRVGCALLALVIGYILAIAARKVVVWLLKMVKFNKGARAIDLRGILAKGEIDTAPDALLETLTFTAVMIAALITAANCFGLQGLKGMVAPLIAYIPSAVAATLVLILGTYLAILLSGIAKVIAGNAGLENPKIIGEIIRYAVLIFVFVLALRQLGAGTLLVGKKREILFAATCFSLALAFGLGGKDKAGKLISRLFRD
ncbi:MAG: hypothetical protein HQ593_03695 [Candidatus Omnitrophica bacterium]|nr:hypothetical protein [Candidatus Omnitrophota bacterium]